MNDTRHQPADMGSDIGPSCRVCGGTVYAYTINVGASTFIATCQGCRALDTWRSVHANPTTHVARVRELHHAHDAKFPR